MFYRKMTLLYLFDQSTDVEAGERGLLSRFQYNSVPAAQRWPQFPCCHHQGEVPLYRHRSGTYCGSSFRQPHIFVSSDYNYFTNDFRLLHTHLETKCFKKTQFHNLYQFSLVCHSPTMLNDLLDGPDFNIQGQIYYQLAPPQTLFWC